MHTKTIEPLIYETETYKVWQDEEAVYILFLDKPNSIKQTYKQDLMERIWEFLDKGQQPARWDGTWNVEEDEWDGGLTFRKHIGSGGTTWGITPKVYKALLAWRKHHRPLTMKEKTILDLTELQKLLNNPDKGLQEYEKTIQNAIRYLNETQSE